MKCLCTVQRKNYSGVVDFLRYAVFFSTGKISGAMKQIFLIAAILSAGTSLYAWEGGDVVFYPGASAKLYYYSFDSPTGTDIENKGGMSYSVGASIDCFLTENIALTAGGYYDRSPEKFDVLASGNYDLSFDFAFLVIPAGFHFYFWDYYFAGVGLYYGKMLGCGYRKYSGYDYVSARDFTNDDKGIWLELGYDIKIVNRINSLIFVRYRKGLVAVYENDNDIITNMKTNELSICLSFGLRI
jgi:hypothetical protein